MKKLLCAALLALCVSTPLMAGDVPFPPEPPPPPCRQDCGNGLTSTTITSVIVKGVLAILYR
jgi:hypothetical protein